MTFATHKYQIFRNFLDKEFLTFIEEYFYLRCRSKQYDVEAQGPISKSFYGDPLIETILMKSCQPLSQLVGVELLPTYAYTRVYGKHDELTFHKDRPSCEISATLSIAYPGDKPNPIYFSTKEDRSDAVEILLEPGDLCMYRGCDLWHWRPPFEHEWYLQSFLHYVDAHGQYKDNIYDGRVFLGIQKGNQVPYEEGRVS